MSSFSSLEIGKRALLAQKYALDATSDNTANVNTANYSRRVAILRESDSTTANGYSGTGVFADTIRNNREEFFDAEIRRTVAQESGYESDETISTRIESILAEPSDIGMTEVVSDFLNSFETLSQNPESVSLRQAAVDSAQTMVDRFNAVGGQLKDVRKEVLGNLNQDVTKANELISQIAEQNKQIQLCNTQSGVTDAQSYIDNREQNLEDLAKIVGVSVTQGDAGAVNVYVNGISIITGTSSSQLKISEVVNSNTGETTAALVKLDDKGNPLTPLSPQTGEMTSLLKHYNVTLDDKDSSGGFSAARKLDEFAASIVSKVNSLSTTGYGLDDKGTVAPGRAFFTPTVGNATASNISISSDIKSDPRKIPASSASNTPGNNDVARKIAQLSSDSNFIDGMTPSEYYSNYLGKIGSMGSEALNGKNTTSLVGEQLTSQRDSIIGVNLDEEAINMIKFQRAFEASSRIITTTSDILTTIVNLGR